MAKNKDGKLHDKKNDDNNELNDAVENIATPDEGTGDHPGHDRQNLQSTVAAATATGAESSDLADEINAALNENPSRAGQEDQGGQRRAEEHNANDDKSQGRGGNKAAQEPTNNGRDNNESNSAGGNEPQSVGGNTPQDSPSGSGNDTPQSKADISSEQQNAGGASGGRGGQARNQEFDTATTSETFEVDVADATAADLSVEDDSYTKSTSETIEIQVDNLNDEVVIDDETAPMFDGVEDTQIVLTEAELLANASDVDGDDLSVENLHIESATFNVEIDPETGEKSFVVTPNENINGELKVTFDVSDQNGSEVASGATLNVAAVNDAAIVTPTEIGGTEDTAITFTQEMLLQNASDVDSDELTALNLSIDAQYGSVIDNSDGTFTFTPAADYNGDIPFTFDVDDNDGAVTPASGSLDIAAVNDVPVLVETSYEVNEDGSIVITEASLLNNATDVDNDVLSVASITSDEHGTVTQSDNGDWVYTPNADYSGDANLTITLNDGTVDAEFNAPVTVTPDADVPSLTVSLTDMTLAEYGVGQDSALTGWHTDNHNNHIEIHQDYVYGVGDDRGGVIELEANRGDESNLYTNLDVQAGDVVTLSFDMSARLHYEGADSQVDVYFEGVLIDSLSPEEAGWESHTYQLTATTDNPRLEFDSPDDNSLGGLLDAITVVKDIIEDQAVPIVIDSAALDTDGSESLQSIVIDNLPDGATLTDGDNTFTASGDDNSADVLGWDLSSLSFQGAENFHGPVSLAVTSTTVENSTLNDGIPETASTTSKLDFDVQAVNDAVVIDADSVPQFNTDEDTDIIITEAALLANANDVDGDDLIVTNLTIDNASFKTVIDSETGEKSFIVTPNQNVNGDLNITFNVSDQNGSLVASDGTLIVEAVNDAPVVSGNVAYNVNEDGTITLTQEELLKHASDVDGDNLTATNLQLEAFGSVEQNEDGSFTITPAENFNGDLQLTFDVTDGQETVSTGLDLTVNPVNDLVVAQDDSSLDGMDPLIRLDAAPEHGSVQYLNEDGEWADMVIGLTYPADTQVQFTPNTEEIQADTRDIRVGSFDSDTSTRIFDGTATVEDWGTVDGDTAVYVEDGVTITTQVNTGELAAWNGAGSHKGAGIGNDSRNGLDTNEMLTVTVEGEDVNQITFQLDGLGSYFDKTSSHATEVNIKAYDADGNLIDTQGGYRDSGEYQDTYVFTTDVPVHHFTLGTTGSDGTYVVQNMTVSRTMSEEIQMTTIQSDGSEISNALNLDLNHSTADQTLDMTEQLIEVNNTITSRAIEVEEDGQLVIQAADLLMNDSDVDGDTLSISAVSTTGDTHGEVSLDEDGNVVFTPDADYNGPASFSYTITDGNGSYDTATVSLNVTPTDDLPVAPSLSFDVDEDQVLVIDPAYILSQASDGDGDQLSLESLSLKQPQNGSLQLQQDGMYHLITPPDFNGLIELDYQISDGNNVVDGGMKVDVLPVNDAPFNGGNAHLTTYEDGAFTFNANDMLDLFGDIDGDNLVISRIINTDGDESGTIDDNEDGTWIFTPTGDYAGTTELQIEVSDPDGLTTMLTMPVFIRPVADGAVITTDHDGPLVFDEDTTGLLGLNVDMIDSSEVLSHLVITGFPVGFEVSDGVHSVMITELGQIVDVTEWSFNDLSITPPQDFSGNFFITVSATTADYGETASSQITQPTDTYADFDVAESGVLTLTTADLLAMVDDIETSPSDEIHGVHLIDRSQGELVDNEDGTWLFTPADGVGGNVDFAYQVNHDGESSDVQSSIAVNEADSNTAPSVDAVVTTEIEAGNTLTFNDGDMLAQLSDAQGDTLSIESVQLITGQGVLETNSEGEYTFVPAEGYTGEAHIAFVATDGEESVRGHFTVDINEAEDDSSQQNSDFMLDEFGALHLAESDILTALNLEPSLDVTSIDYNGDDGALVENGDGNWVFWTDDDFNGLLELDVSTTDGDSAAMHSLQLNVAEYEDPEASSPTERQADEASAQENHDIQTVTLDAQAAQDNDITNDSEADITAAPGSTVRIDIPDDVTANPDVEQVEISNLPEGATISNGILNDDGSYTISGNLSRPVKIELADENEGKEEITFEGQSEIGTPIEGATGTVTIEVDDDHAMHSGHRGNDNSRGMHDEDDSKGDWMQGDNRDQGVDVMDDSASYENDEHTAQQDDSNVMDDNYS